MAPSNDKRVAETGSHTDLHLVNLMLAALAVACVLAALAGSITH